MKNCRIFMNLFGASMLAISIIMGITSYFWKSEQRTAMAEIRAGHVPPTKVRVAGVSTRIIKETLSAGHSVRRLSKIVSFVTEDGRYFDKGWSRAIEHQTGDWYKGFLVEGRLYVPDLYNEVEPIYLGFLSVGGVFFVLFWAGGVFICKRVEERHLRSE